MYQQRHIVKRQVIEITTDMQPLAERAQNKISRHFLSQMNKLIDKHCSKYSAPDTLYRIHSLELDLGSISIEKLEKELIHRLDRVLKKQLPKHISGPFSSNDQTRKMNKITGKENENLADNIHQNDLGNRIELLSYFARNGYLPWWADTRNENLLEYCLDDLLQNPAVLKPLFQAIARQKKSLLRIIEYYEDAKLQQLLVVLTATGEYYSAYPAKRLISLIGALSSVEGDTQKRIRQVVWYALLQNAILSRQQMSNELDYLYSLVHSISKRLAVPFMVLVRELHTNKDFIKIQTAHVDYINLLLEFSGNPKEPKFLDKLQKLLKKIQPPVYIVKELLRSLQQVKLDKSDSTLFLQKVTELTQALNETVDRGQLEKKQQHEALIEKEKENHFFTTDEIYIENAGLAVLSPFLERFFNNMSWIQDREFKNKQAQQRALMALHYLATASITAPEYMLPLNKILCGLPVDELYLQESLFEQDEIDNCDQFLQAVIDNAPILKNTTVNGFRSSFLLRQGIISQRDGAWLLRIERQTHDIVIDRFPWSFEWIRLPWMPMPMKVEW